MKAYKRNRRYSNKEKNPPTERWLIKSEIVDLVDRCIYYQHKNKNRNYHKNYLITVCVSGQKVKDIEIGHYRSMLLSCSRYLKRDSCIKKIPRQLNDRKKLCLLDKNNKHSSNSKIKEIEMLLFILHWIYQNRDNTYEDKGPYVI